ncbi:MAG TPA: HNH endonuclease signature motif containing protein [Mycobacteriales bacterium]|nr:HNH endonuclease signature motif containing protein [Mycobacteriales bacterium]
MTLMAELAAEHALTEDLPPWSEAVPEMPAWLAEAPPSSWVEPPRCEHGCGEVCGAEPEGWVLPEVPVELLAWDARRPGPVLVGPSLAEVDAFRVSEPVQAEVFAHHFEQAQVHIARMWRAAGQMIATAGVHRAEFVGDHLALLMGVHPRSGRHVAFTAWVACQVPRLLELVEAGELTDRHVTALLEEAGRWTGGDREQLVALITATLDRCAARVDAGHGWPTPGQLRKRLQTTAVLHDLTAAEKAARSVAERRGVSAWPSGVGAGTLTIEGPQACIGQMHDAIRARAEAMGRLPGDARTLAQRMHDAAFELLTVDADGGPSAVPAVGEDGEPVTLTVRGVQVALIVPVSDAAGGEREMAEIPGLGPVLPSTARELLAQADTVQRITVDATTGQVLTVDAPAPGPAAAEEPVRELVEQVVSAPVVIRDLSSEAYRPPDRLRRHVERRDRTCAFPGCTVPGERCDLDHREPWPHGPTSEENCHCLCRRHHRAKQTYFTVELDEDGSTVWTTPDGWQYRRPPPTY